MQINEEKKNVLGIGLTKAAKLTEEFIEKAKKIRDSLQPARGHNKLWLWIAVIMLLGLGGFAVSMRKHELHEVHVKAYTPPTTSSVYKYPLQLWPVKASYINTYSATNLQAVETEMMEQLDLIPKDDRPPCLHASSLGVAVDTMIIEVKEKRYIIRDVLNVAGVGKAMGAYHTSVLDSKQLLFRRLYNELEMHFITAIQVGTTAKQKAAISSPLRVEDRELARCIQLYFAVR